LRILDKFWDEVLCGVLKDKQSNDVILIAGDLSHYNLQTMYFLKYLKSKYKHVVWVHGNHDLYMISKHMVKAFNNDSTNRLNHMINMSNEVGAKYLDGDIINIDGVKIGGGSSWYDGSYCQIINEKYKEYKEVKKLWSESMNDCNYIYMQSNNWLENGFIEYSKQQIEKVENILMESDVILTHISPNFNTISNKYKNDPTSGFYTYTSNLYKEITNKVWVFGHMHDMVNYTDENNNWLICNPLGYKNENPNHKGILTIDL
jgi:Icc-related predicted phosphoesterase